MRISELKLKLSERWDRYHGVTTLDANRLANRIHEAVLLLAGSEDVKKRQSKSFHLYHFDGPVEQVLIYTLQCEIDCVQVSFYSTDGPSKTFRQLIVNNASSVVKSLVAIGYTNAVVNIPKSPDSDCASVSVYL